MKWLVVGALTLQLPICWLAIHAADWPMFAVAVLMAVFTLGLQPVVDSLVAHYVPLGLARPRLRHALSGRYRHQFGGGARRSAGSMPRPAISSWLFAGLGGIAAVGAAGRHPVTQRGQRAAAG